MQRRSACEVSAYIAFSNGQNERTPRCRFLISRPQLSHPLNSSETHCRRGLAGPWATAGVLASESLLDACLNDKRVDRQCEDKRGEWKWRLISVTGKASKFREPLLNAHRNESDGYNASQLCHIALHFALCILLEAAMWRFAINFTHLSDIGRMSI